jgi:D-alanyl-D-alanine carboxypeptidase/D-alanyl-D-alanine-endopeptidase (penicillin-binding protein 4)
MVKSLATGETLYARNPRTLLLPASSMKIVTLAAIAERHGWDHTFPTTLSIAGRVAGGVLDGDLVVTGSGDPSLGLADGSADRVFKEWAERLKQLGIRTVNGRIVGDDNAFEDQTLGFGWSWDDLPDDYAAGVGALQFNESAVRVRIAPGPAVGEYAGITTEPSYGIEVVSSVTTATNGSPTSLGTSRLPGSERLQISGTIAADATPATLLVAVDNPTLYFVRGLRSALVANGIDVRGAAVDIDDITANPSPPIDTHPLLHRSPPISTLAVRLMKDSQNQYAETFLKWLSTPAANTGPLTAFGARAAYQEIFDRWGVHAGGMIVRDGSGLSRYDFVTAEALVTVLEHVYKDDKLRGPFEASLPVAGRDGTLTNRFKGTAAEGNVRAKTGSMTGVRTLSGYLTTANSEPVVFAILANNFETPADVVNRATDAIVLRLIAYKK